MHGKTDQIHHDDRDLYEGLENPFKATRYHSLLIQPDTLADSSRLRLEQRPRRQRAKSWAFATGVSRCLACSSIPKVS